MTQHARAPVDQSGELGPQDSATSAKPEPFSCDALESRRIAPRLARIKVRIGGRLWLDATGGAWKAQHERMPSFITGAWVENGSFSIELEFEPERRSRLLALLERVRVCVARACALSWFLRRITLPPTEAGECSTSSPGEEVARPRSDSEAASTAREMERISLVGGSHVFDTGRPWVESNATACISCGRPIEIDNGGCYSCDGSLCGRCCEQRRNT